MAINDTLETKTNWSYGLLLQNKYLISSNFGNFTYYGIGLNAGYRTFSLKVATNFFDKNKFIKSNYNIGTRLKHKYPFAGYNIGLNFTPRFEKKQSVKVFYSIEYIRSTVYIGTQDFYKFAGYTLSKTINNDDKFTQFMAGIGLDFNMQNIIHFTPKIMFGNNSQSNSNSHIKSKGSSQSSDSNRYDKKKNCAMLSFSLIYNINGSK